MPEYTEQSDTAFLIEKHRQNVIGSERLLANLFIHHQEYALHVLRGVKQRVVELELSPLPELEPPPPPPEPPKPVVVASRPIVTLKQIIKEVAAKHLLDVDDLSRDSRTPAIVNARAEYYYRAFVETGKASTIIGHEVSVDHATAIYGCQRYAMMHRLPLPRGMKANAKIRRKFGDVESRVA